MGAFFVENEDGTIREFDDPSGGTFQAAGDFDGLMARHHDDLPLLGTVDPYADRSFSSEELASLSTDVSWLLGHTSGDTNPGFSQGTPGVSRRGLLRLEVLIRFCISHPEFSLSWEGD